MSDKSSGMPATADHPLDHDSAQALGRVSSGDQKPARARSSTRIIEARKCRPARQPFGVLSYRVAMPRQALSPLIRRSTAATGLIGCRRLTK